MTVETVVARYTEDVEWCRTFIYPCTIYTKTEPTTFGLNYISIPVDDDGREASTWLSHIITHYDRLADFTIFLQGKYDDHCPDLIEKLKFDVPFTWLTIEMLGQRKDDGYMNITYNDFYLRLFSANDLPESIRFGRGGMFMASKELIQSHPVEYYQRILNICKGTFKGIVWARYFERFWEIILKKEIV